MKIVNLVGTRPQLIKAAVISRAIKKFNRSHGESAIQEVLIDTGQHYDHEMSGAFFEELLLPEPNINLGISSLSHGAMLGRMTEALEGTFKKVAPDWIIVYGDTNTTLSGSLAASKMGIPVAHVEAGVRNGYGQSPEEMNRALTDRISTILFCPTKSSVETLKSEGYPFQSPIGTRQRMINVGDVMFDATRIFKEAATDKSILRKFGLIESGYVYFTMHRAKNTDCNERLKNILLALRKVAVEMEVVFPMHPRVSQRLKHLDAMHWLDGITVLRPVSYVESQGLAMSAARIVTDSGGLQREAYFYGKQCATLTEETSWNETVESGGNLLVGASPERILEAVLEERSKADIVPGLFGDGRAAEKIIDEVVANVDA